MAVIINEEARRVMIQDAEKTFPNECCGFMYGHEVNEDREVTEAVPVQNEKEGDQRRRFEISPLQYMKAEQYAEENNLSLLGVYHSHPQHPAIPSEHDRKQAMPWFSYVILSVMDGRTDDITSWQLNDDREFDEEPIKSELIF
ncbi:Mov34/MPN/PAD-1 family protein [Roseivirga sp. BDSF3-8]|uniref:Mov34/MPN/PAD-1 family protein n=1 Tax=Roseivirga sp. BDSF3-8 TaxID=3241598 RepID=UPI003531F94B